MRHAPSCAPQAASRERIRVSTSDCALHAATRIQFRIMADRACRAWATGTAADRNRTESQKPKPHCLSPFCRSVYWLSQPQRHNKQAFTAHVHVPGRRLLRAVPVPVPLVGTCGVSHTVLSSSIEFNKQAKGRSSLNPEAKAKARHGQRPAIATGGPAVLRNQAEIKQKSSRAQICCVKYSMGRIHDSSLTNIRNIARYQVIVIVPLPFSSIWFSQGGVCRRPQRLPTHPGPSAPYLGTEVFDPSRSHR